MWAREIYHKKDIIHSSGRNKAVNDVDDLIQNVLLVIVNQNHRKENIDDVFGDIINVTYVPLVPQWIVKPLWLFLNCRRGFDGSAAIAR